MSARVGSSPVGVRRLLDRGALHPCPCPGAERVGQGRDPQPPVHRRADQRPGTGTQTAAPAPRKALRGHRHPGRRDLRLRLRPPVRDRHLPDRTCSRKTAPAGWPMTATTSTSTSSTASSSTPETGVIDSGRATGIAVHPLTKDLYVSHRNAVDVYEAPVEPGNPPAHVFGTGTLGNAYGVAVSAFPATEGDVYVADASDHTVKVYDPSVSLTQRRSRSSMAPTPPRAASSRSRTPASPSTRATATSSSSTTPRRSPSIPAPPSTSSTPAACSAASSNTRSSTERPSGSPSTNPRRPPTARST